MPSKPKAKSSGPKNIAIPPTQQVPSAGIKSTDPYKNEKAKVRENIPSVKGQQDPAQPVPSKSTSPQLPAPGSTDAANSAPGVNRKKQKRRMKEAAKRAAADQNDATTPTQGHGIASHANGYDYGTSDYEGAEQYGTEDGDDIYYTDEASRNYAAQLTNGLAQPNGYTNHNYISQEPLGIGKKKKKQKANNAYESSYQAGNTMPLSHSGHFQHLPPPPPPPLSQTRSNSMIHAGREGSKDRIWNTSTAEERERIKEFWLSLGEGDRRGLVRIEKEAVLKKMKEQQKHSCSCTVCGRKRTAIEEELEVLYDAYYEELETYANHQQFGLDASSIPPPRSYARPRPNLPPSQSPVLRGGQLSRGRIEELDDDGNAGDGEEYSDEDEDDISDSEIDPPMRPSGGIFNFGNSLTAQGGILTVADDLLKNDGKKFIEMMEQLAERRMQREEESRMVASGMGHPSMRHGPPEEEDDGYEDEEDEEDYNSEEDDEFEDDELEAMTEEQRMEEGRRMFQIFAARMFEQRVLNAYRQKVAEERQKKLIEELAEDEQLDAQREAKRAKEAQKKKEKRQKQKQARDEEKAKREAEKAAAEATTRAVEEKKLEEQRQRKEEQRKKKEAEKKAAEDEKNRKEEEKHRQMQERREQQAELERKQREQKDREKRKREEAKKKEREDREAKEKEIRDQKERESIERKEREGKTRMESNEKERLQQEALPKQAVSVPKTQSPANAPQAITSISSSLVPPHTSSSHASPRLPVATPVLPKAPTPGRVRQKSAQDSRATSPKPSQPTSSSAASPVTSEQQNTGPAAHYRKASQPGLTQPSAQPRFSPAAGPPGVISQPPGFVGMTPMANNGFSPSFGPPMSPRGQHTQPHHPPGFPNPYPFSGNHYRGNNVPYPPVTSSTRQFPPTQAGGNGQTISQRPENALTNSANKIGRSGTSHDPVPAHTHSRNQSASSNISPRDPNPRPAPIQRPSSVTPHQQNENVRPSSKDVDDLSNHLGSSALLDDTDVAAESAIDDLRRGSMPVGGQRAARHGFGGAPGLAPIGTSARTENGHQQINMWSSLQSPLAPLGRAPQPFGSAPGFGRSPNGNAFRSAGVPVRSNAPRALRVRNMVSSICDKWTTINPTSHGWHVVDQVCGEMQTLMPRSEPPVLIMEMLQICDSEGNAQNGGGWFEWRPAEKSPFLMKHHTGTDPAINGRVGPPPGDIGSPISGSAMGSANLPPIGGQPPFQQTGRP